MAWIRQFEPFGVAELALQALEAFKIIGRADLRRAIEGLFNATPGLKEPFIVPLGIAKDSGAVAGYWSDDVASAHGASVVHLGEALVRSADRPLVFVDDFVGSGRQARSIIANWFGDSSLANALGEDRGIGLVPELQAALRGRPVGFAYSAGFATGLTAVVDEARSRGMTVIGQHVAIDASQLPSAEDDSLYSGSASVADFVTACRTLGEALVLAETHDSTKSQQRALGYGNHGLLVAFPYNVPSQCLTCIWKGGPTGIGQWSPLLSRRKKK
jgi:hypothetical protein